MTLHEYRASHTQEKEYHALEALNLLLNQKLTFLEVQFERHLAAHQEKDKEVEIENVKTNQS